MIRYFEKLTSKCLENGKRPNSQIHINKKTKNLRVLFASAFRAITKHSVSRRKIVERNVLPFFCSSIGIATKFPCDSTCLNELIRPKATYRSYAYELCVQLWNVYIRRLFLAVRKVLKYFEIAKTCTYFYLLYSIDRACTVKYKLYKIMIFKIIL